MLPTRIERLLAKPKRPGGWTYAAFRAWRERELPRAAYQIAAKVWRPESLAKVAGEPDAKRRALKNWQPRFTGMAYSDRELYLVEVVGQLTEERIGKALYRAYLFHSDPDYVEHRGKQVHLIILARDATTSLREFAAKLHPRGDFERRERNEGDRLSRVREPVGRPGRCFWLARKRSTLWDVLS